MFSKIPFQALLLFSLSLIANCKSKDSSATKYLDSLETAFSREWNKYATARWEYAVDLSTCNQDALKKAHIDFIKYNSKIHAQLQKTFPRYRDLKPDIVRRIQLLLLIEPVMMMHGSHDIEKLVSYQKNLQHSYLTTKVCNYNRTAKCKRRIKPHLTLYMQNLKDPKKLEYYWTQWHEVIGESTTADEYSEYIQAYTGHTKAHKFRTLTDMFLEQYRTSDRNWKPKSFLKQLDDFWKKLEPSYQTFQSYLRYKLRQDPRYKKSVKSYGYIPVHLTGDMWGESWTSWYPKTKPQPGSKRVSLTRAMRRKSYTVKRIMDDVDDFYSSMGFSPMKKFIAASQIESDRSRKVNCEPELENMGLEGTKSDFRIRMCMMVNEESMLEAYELGGKLAYAQQYQDQPVSFRRPANPAFDEAVGGAFALAARTPTYLQCHLKLKMGVSCLPAKNRPIDSADINFLYKTALRELPSLALAYSILKWRVDVADGKLSSKDYTKRWWKYRGIYQGVKPPPKPRNSSIFFDPIERYEITKNEPYPKTFIAKIMAFQLYEAMCIKAGEYNPKNPRANPLHRCSLYGKEKAGKAMRNMMRLGASKPWPEALKAVTGKPTISMSPILSYFLPLTMALAKQLDLAGFPTCFGRKCQPYASNYMTKYFEKTSGDYCQRTALADWNYNTDLTNATAEKLSISLRQEFMTFTTNEWAANFSQFEWEHFKKDQMNTKRQLELLSNIGTAALPENDSKELIEVLSEMSKIYSTAKICPYKRKTCDLSNNGLSLNPEIEAILSDSTNYEELKYVWVAWRNASGKKIKKMYTRYIQLNNKAAVLNGLANMGDSWNSNFESDTFKADCEDLWKQIKPLYTELYSYVRYKLSKIYKQVSLSKPLPAHIFGNMWAQSWGKLYKYVIPFPKSPKFDFTAVLKKKFKPDQKGVRKMFHVADEFFVSLGLKNTSSSYGDKAVIVKPKNKSVVCHASAWDLCTGKDFRIKMCTNVDWEDFITIHHELGHIQYYMQYKDQPSTFREGANTGFHEAIGDVIALSVSSPKHMPKIGFAPKTSVTKESILNFLMKIALDKIAFIPFGYLIDAYRWKLFDGSVKSDKYNYEWIKMRSEYQGVVPPVKRSEQDFDAGCKYHVPGDTPYIRYFVSHILQFQIHKSLCETAGELDKGPLYECDIYNSKAAGDQLRKILQAGISKNWQHLLQETIGTRSMTAHALLEYFEPLAQFLKAQRKLHKYPYGWDAEAFSEYYSA